MKVNVNGFAVEVEALAADLKVAMLRPDFDMGKDLQRILNGHLPPLSPDPGEKLHWGARLLPVIVAEPVQDWNGHVEVWINGQDTPQALSCGELRHVDGRRVQPLHWRL